MRVQRSTLQNALGLGIWLLLTFGMAGIGAWATRNAPLFYAQLFKPDWAPPASVFGPMWTALYGLMAIAAWMVWQRASLEQERLVFVLFLVQLALNALWSWLFFAWHQGGLAFVEILVLWLCIAFTMRAFWRVQPWAGILLLPYLLWVSFASCLTYAVWQRNPQLLG